MIHALVDKSAVPLVYVLMVDKSEKSYLRVFQKLRELRPNLNPLSVMSDYEKASQNAISHVFPNTQLIGCLFHLGQSLWKKVQSLHLDNLYRDDENIRIHIRMLLALSFVPLQDVPLAFETLADDSPQEIVALLDYWEDNYVGRQRRNKRAQPRYPISIWNVRNRVTDGLPRVTGGLPQFSGIVAPSFPKYSQLP